MHKDASTAKSLTVMHHLEPPIPLEVILLSFLRDDYLLNHLTPSDVIVYICSLNSLSDVHTQYGSCAADKATWRVDTESQGKFPAPMRETSPGSHESPSKSPTGCRSNLIAIRTPGRSRNECQSPTAKPVEEMTLSYPQ